MDGSREYNLAPAEKSERGTEIILHLNAESEEFLESGRIRSILEKFCRFLPVPIHFADKQINNTQPAWLRKPSELTKEDYEKF